MAILDGGGHDRRLGPGGDAAPVGKCSQPGACGQSLFASACRRLAMVVRMLQFARVASSSMIVRMARAVYSRCRAARRSLSTPAAEAAAVTKSARSEEHTSELQSLMRNSYAVFCLT